MYEYNPTKGLGYSPGPRATARNVPPAMGWTGGFYIPDNEQRFSQQTCSGSAAVPMDSSSDLVCGRSAEVNYLNNIGCVPVGFQGSHHCLTDAGNQGIFHCCPPGVLESEMARAAGLEQEDRRSLIPSGIVLGLGALGIFALGYVTWADWKEKREMLEELG